MKIILIFALLLTGCNNGYDCDKKIQELFTEDDIDYFSERFIQATDDDFYYLIKGNIYKCRPTDPSVDIERVNIYNERQKRNNKNKEKPIKLFKVMPPKKPPPKFRLGKKIIK